MLTLIRSEQVRQWMQDLRGKAAIAKRLLAAQLGNFGYCEPVGDGISEMKIDFGPGYRIYYTRTGDVVYVLLVAGTKRTQRRDIALAKTMLKHFAAAPAAQPKPKTRK